VWRRIGCLKKAPTSPSAINTEGSTGVDMIAHNFSSSLAKTQQSHTKFSLILSHLPALSTHWRSFSGFYIDWDCLLIVNITTRVKRAWGGSLVAPPTSRIPLPDSLLITCRFLPSSSPRSRRSFLPMTRHSPSTQHATTSPKEWTDESRTAH
jgi:hypothetical protein